MCIFCSLLMLSKVKSILYWALTCSILSWPKVWHWLNVYNFWNIAIFRFCGLLFKFYFKKYIKCIISSYQIIPFIIESYFNRQVNFTEFFEWCQTFGHECIYQMAFKCMQYYVYHICHKYCCNLSIKILVVMVRIIYKLFSFC